MTMQSTASGVRVACDVGGTFTDVCVLNESSGRIHVAKTPTTPDPIDGVLKGINGGGVALKDIVLFSHGTTLATNALITRRFPPALMVTTKGFRDVIEIRRGTRDDLWDTYKEMAPPYLARRDRLTVSERVDYSGKIIEQVNEAEARDLARIIKKRGVNNVAVCFVNSFMNASNEQRMRDILLEEIPDLMVSLSSDIMPEIFEHERFNTTVANTVLGPVSGQYGAELEHRMQVGGYKGEVLLLHSGGGVMTAKGATRFPARLAASGIAAGAIASRFIAELAGYKNSISLDMGGTSTDISLCWDGHLHVTRDWHVQYGYPIRFPSIEVLTIGAGGGSLAWRDAAGALRNGPQSAGSAPGPVCYNQGGTEPTNCDANVYLGRLGTKLAGGQVELDVNLAAQAIDRVIAEPFGMDTEQAALSIIKVANANMGDAVRLVSLRKGYDPRDFVLVAFGGAGALHGVALARDLHIPTVLIPPNPGVTSALGCLLVDITHDITQMYTGTVGQINMDDLNNAFGILEEEGRNRLLVEDISPDRMLFQRFVDMRYLGQWRSISIPVSGDIHSLDEAVKQFHEEHGREHNYSRPDAPVEVCLIQVKATGLNRKAELAKYPIQNDKALPAPVDERMVRFDEADARVKTPVYNRDDLHAGARVPGPAIIDQLDATILVPPGIVAEVDQYLIIKMDVPLSV